MLVKQVHSSSCCVPFCTPVFCAGMCARRTGRKADAARSSQKRAFGHSALGRLQWSCAHVGVDEAPWYVVAWLCHYMCHLCLSTCLCSCTHNVRLSSALATLVLRKNKALYFLAMTDYDCDVLTQISSCRSSGDESVALMWSSTNQQKNGLCLKTDSRGQTSCQ